MASTEFEVSMLETYLGDIYGLQDSKTGKIVKKGLLSQTLKVSTKQHLKVLAREMTKEKTTYDESVKELKTEFFKGEEFKEDMLKEDLIEKLTELNKTKVSITHSDFKSVVEDISNLVCEEDYALTEVLLTV